MFAAEFHPPPLFDETKDRRLSEVLAPCFALILNLRATDHFGDIEVLRRRTKDLLDQTEREAQRAGIPAEDVRAAQFALVALIDETILSSNWDRKTYWLSRPLQMERFDRFDAGEEFFNRLDRLRAQSHTRSEVLEVYYLCMALGFKGKYQLHGQDQLRILIEDTYKELSRTPGLGAGQLSPHGRPRDQTATEVRNKLPVWIIVVVATVAGLLVYIGMSLYISDTAQDTARVIEQVVPMP